MSRPAYAQGLLTCGVRKKDGRRRELRRRRRANYVNDAVNMDVSATEIRQAGARGRDGLAQNTCRLRSQIHKKV